MNSRIRAALIAILTAGRRRRDQAELDEWWRHLDTARRIDRQLDFAAASLSLTKKTLIVGVVTTLLTAIAIVVPLVYNRSGQGTGPADAIIEFGDNSADTPVWVVPAELNTLGEPPPYVRDPPSEQEYHCDEWHGWLNIKGAAPIFGAAYIFIAAPADDVVAIVDARVRVLRKYASPSTLR